MDLNTVLQVGDTITLDVPGIGIYGPRQYTGTIAAIDPQGEWADFAPDDTSPNTEWNLYGDSGTGTVSVLTAYRPLPLLAHTHDGANSANVDYGDLQNLPDLFTQPEADALYEPIGEAASQVATHTAIAGAHHASFVQADADLLYVPWDSTVDTKEIQFLTDDGVDDGNKFRFIGAADWLIYAKKGSLLGVPDDVLFYSYNDSQNDPNYDATKNSIRWAWESEWGGTSEFYYEVHQAGEALGGYRRYFAADYVHSLDHSRFVMGNNEDWLAATYTDWNNATHNSVSVLGSVSVGRSSAGFMGLVDIYAATYDDIGGWHFNPVLNVEAEEVKGGHYLQTWKAGGATKGSMSDSGGMRAQHFTAELNVYATVGAGYFDFGGAFSAYTPAGDDFTFQRLAQVDDSRVNMNKDLYVRHESTQYQNAWIRVPYRSDPGLTNLADADFDNTPPDGSIGVVYDETSTKSYFAVRTNGSWKSVELA
jgi:hypothetical protein